MARPTKQDWLEARQRWEADVPMTMGQVAESMGVSVAAVSKTAKAHGWVKSGSLPSINRAAQVKADAAEVDGQVNASTAKKPLAASVEASTELRAKLIQAHRAEWRRHASLYSLEGIKADFNEGKSAKITAEMLSIRQKGERVAWGMDTEVSDNGIVINNPRSFDAS